MGVFRNFVIGDGLTFFSLQGGGGLNLNIVVFFNEIVRCSYSENSN